VSGAPLLCCELNALSTGYYRFEKRVIFAKQFKEKSDNVPTKRKFQEPESHR
jgi:hypothetical protein